MINSFKQCTAKGPINIALIKYWGKEDEENIIPLNNSISITLDMNKLYTETTIIADLMNKDNDVELFISDNKEKVNDRVKKIIKYFRENTKDNNLSMASLKIISKNTFPTAAGCASSASSMSCLVTALEGIFDCGFSKHELSSLARLGSGSACRSIFGGLVEWEKCSEEHINMSIARQIVDSWPELRILLLIVSDKRKDTSSTDGMKCSKETSEFLQCRIEKVLPKRIPLMRKAIQEKDFTKVAELTMKDSNNFHSVCRDTYPPINYLNDTSNFIIKCVEKINSMSKDEMTCGYTFDAGPNAFIILQQKDFDKVYGIFNNVFQMEESKQLDEHSSEIVAELSVHRDKIGAEIKKMIPFFVGEGAHLIHK